MTKQQMASDVQWERQPWFALPSWGFSLALHAVLLLFLALTLQRPTVSGQKAGGDRVVGIYTKESHDAVAESPAVPSDAAETQPVLTGQKPSTANESLQLEDTPPVPVSLPAAGGGRIGPGPMLPAAPGSDARELIKGARGGVSGAAVAATFCGVAAGAGSGRDSTGVTAAERDGKSC